MILSILSSVASILAVLCIVMVISGVLKETGAVVSVYSILKSRISSKRGLVAILSVIFGVIPVPGRICFTCSILDSIQDKSKNNQKMGVISHLSAHHYYLWSPMEKAIIIVCGILGITYTSFISVMWVPALLMVAFSTAYIFFAVSEDEVSLVEVTYDPTNKGAMSVLGLFLCIIGASFFPAYTTWIFGGYALALVQNYGTFKKEWIDMKVLGFATGAVVLGGLIGSYQKAVLALVPTLVGSHGIFLLAVLAFLAALAMGSSAKYAAVCGALVKLVGIKYLPLLYLVEFSGYMMSPSHDCVAIAKSYFKTPVGMFILPIVELSFALIFYGILVLL